MNSVRSVGLIIGLFAVRYLVAGNIPAPVGLGFAVGCGAAILYLIFDRKIRSFNAPSQWMLVRTQAVYSAFGALLFAAISVWAMYNGKEPGLDFAGLGVFAGFSVGSLLWWAWARRRAVA